ncbi:MAG: CocE/NonD family hydrolase, partial [Deltaproteobacteria bacterium]|nr:CocE/NonD family hydrolase [Deltaproteobacteria bacterium]
AFGRKMPVVQKILENDTFNEEWKKIQLFEEDFKKIDLPVMHVTGWFDGDQVGAMHYYLNMIEHSPNAQEQYLLIGPWDHPQTFFGGIPSLGDMKFTEDSVVDNNLLHLQFFDHYLKGTAPTFEHPKVRIYITGINEWRESDAFPFPTNEEKRLYLTSGGNAGAKDSDGKLSWEAPGEEPTDHFVFDPKNPAPGMLHKPGAPSALCLGVDISEHVEARDDVLTYTSEVLEETLIIAGHVEVELYAATDGSDTDFVVWLTDVHPDGKSVNLGPASFGILRGRFREGYEKEVLLTPGKPEKYRIKLWHIGHAFLPGHRVRVQVTSGAYPDIAPNQNTGNPVPTDTEWRIANQTIYHDTLRPSAVILPVVKA